MREYKYQGESFSVEMLNDCEARISDDKNSTTISLSSGGAKYVVSAVNRSGGGQAANSVGDAIAYACKMLIQYRNREGICKDLEDFVALLPDKS